MGYWTDYLKTFLHPRSLYQLPGVWQGQGRFGAFGEGKGLFGVSETRDEIMDRVRYWAEECDTFQVGTSHPKPFCLCDTPASLLFAEHTAQPALYTYLHSESVA